jgi:tetratricopeptide (TPR) repeat protein
MSFSGKFVGTLCVSLGALALVNGVKTLSDSPAFVEAARVDGVFGDWRLQTGPALYDRSEYLFQLGYGYLSTDSVASAATENVGEVATNEVAMERAQQAISLLTESLKLSPGNAHAWATLTDAQLLTDDFEGAMQSLQTSWELAPYNASLSIQRLGIVEVMLQLGQDARDFGLAELAPPEFSENDLSRIEGDIEVAQRYRSRQLDIFMQNAEFVAEMVSKDL